MRWLAVGASLLLFSSVAAAQQSALGASEHALDSTWQTGHSAWSEFNRAVMFERHSPFDVRKLRDLQAAVALYQKRGAAEAAAGSLALGRAFKELNLMQLSSPMSVTDSARLYFQKSGERFLALNDTIGMLRVIRSMMETYPPNYTDLQRLLVTNEPPASWLDSARTLNRAARAAYEAGNTDTAIRYYQSALDFWRAEPKPAGTIHTLNAIGELFLTRAQFDSAGKYIRRASELGDMWGVPEQRGRTFSNLAFVAFAAGQNQLALKLGESTRLQEHKVGAVAAALSQLALARPGGAYLTLLRDAPQFTDDNSSGEFSRVSNHPLVWGWYYLAAGGALTERGHLEFAARALQRAKPYLQRSGDHARIVLADAYMEKLRTAVVTGSRKRTPLELPRALAQLQQVQAMERPSEIEKRVGGTAEKMLRDAAQSLRDDQLSLAHAFNDVGSAYARERTANWIKAAAYYDSAAIAYSRVRLYFADDATRIAYADRMVELGERGAAAWWSQSREIGNQKAGLAALGMIERGRSIAFQYLRKDAPPDTGATIRRVAWAERGSDAVGSVDGFEHLSAAMLGERVATEAFYFGREQAGLVYYFSNDTLTTWVLKRSDGYSGRLATGVTMVRTAVPSEKLTSLIRDMRLSLNVDSASRSLHFDPGIMRVTKPVGNITLTQLSEILLPAAVRRQLPDSGSLVIVPHGPIAQVPFAALPVDSAGTRVLADIHALRYGLSLSTLVMATGQGTQLPADAAARAEWLKRALIVGDPVMPSVKTSDGTSRSLRALPGAAEEAASIASMLNAELLPREQATETKIQERIRNASIVHLATHGIAYGDAADHTRSFVALAPGGGDDGLLTVGEILTENFKLESADLVVLSACQTGLGHIAQSEGTLGLNRAFLARGARSVLVSLWSVDDATTRELMEAFYSHWLEDADKPAKTEALARAQRDVRKKYPHPRYWAAFQLFGAN